MLEPKLKDNQFGGMKGSSPTLALLSLIHQIQAALESPGNFCRILMLDFSKAYDHIDHGILLNKLKTFDIPDFMIKWFHAFLFDRKQRVCLQEHFPEWVRINGGVPQGTLSGPRLFLAMIDDLQVTVPNIKYMDDTTLFDVSQRSENTEKIDQAVQETVVWAEKNNMKFNTEKTKEIVFSFLKNHTAPSISINNSTITRVDTAKLLGVHISSDLKWEAHIQNIYSKSSIC